MHGLRHTANDLLRRVADGEVVRAIIEHTTQEMPHHYSHVDEKEKRTAVAAALALVLDAKGGIPGGACTNSNATTIPPALFLFPLGRLRLRRGRTAAAEPTRPAAFEVAVDSAVGARVLATLPGSLRQRRPREAHVKQSNA